MKHDIDDILDTKITVHDSRHFEIKLDIDLPTSRSSSYEIDTYFFVPKALNVSPATYSSNDFYTGIQKYIRFKTPQISLDKITDPSVPSSPWTRIGKALNDLLAHSLTQAATDDLIQVTFEEIKLLGQIIKASLRDTTLSLVNEIDSLNKTGQNQEREELLAKNVRRLILEITNLERSMLERKQEISRPQVASRIKDGFYYLDEFFSITVEDHLSLLYQRFTDTPSLKNIFESIKSEIQAVLLAQQTHRKAMGYSSLISSTGDNSIFPYRKGVLKKFTSSSLHLNLETSEVQALSQLNFSIAAGIAMLFAAVVTVFAQTRFSTSSSMFVMTVVVSYILKDRMKDWLKVFLSKRMLRGAADSNVKIRDPGTRQVVGKFREAFAFVEYSQLPDVIRARRNMDNITSIDEEGKPERVMKYEKQVTLYPKKISKFHQRRRDINDIMRFDVSQWVKQADDPKTKALHFDDATKTLKEITCSKVYHLNIVFRYQTAGPGGKMRDTFERIRLILNRDGIVQLEEVR